MPPSIACGVHTYSLPAIMEIKFIKELRHIPVSQKYNTIYTRNI
jgi:hypothetical protein